MSRKPKMPITKNSIEKQEGSCPTAIVATTAQLLRAVCSRTPVHITIIDIIPILLLLLCIHTDTVIMFMETFTCFLAMHSTRQCGLIQHQVHPILVNHLTCTPMRNRTGTTVAHPFRICLVIIQVTPITSPIPTMYFTMVQTRLAAHTTVFRKAQVHIMD